jgi:hypothetical protein
MFKHPKLMRAPFAAVVAAVAATACGGGGDYAAPVKRGEVALLLKDAPVQTSDGRPADEVNVEILRIQLERDSEDSEQEDQDEGLGNDHANDEVTVFDAPAGSGIKVNLLALDIPTLLLTLDVPAGLYEEVELRLNPANATIHFTDDGSTEPLVVGRESEDEAELEFEFEPPLTVAETGVTNALIDFAPLVELDGTDYILGHDHEADDSGEIEDGEDGDSDEGDDHGQIEMEGDFVERNGDILTIVVNGSPVELNIASATGFEVDDVTATRDEFLAALAAGVEVKAKGALDNGVFVAEEVEVET